LISLALIFAYTYRGGLKPSSSLILYKHFKSLLFFLTIYFFICQINIIGAFEAVKNSNYSKIFFFEISISKFHFVKQILGIFVTIAMVGLDQDLMQKNLSCATIGEAQKNMFAFTGIFVLINIFLSVGAFFIFMQNGIEFLLI
jgi:hypothetical protein